jgi:hypothetical protein
MTDEQINTAALAHALDVLGQAQFDANPDAVASIAGDFIVGAEFVRGQRA